MQPPASPPATGHVGLAVRNLDRSLDFYRSALGFQLAARQEAHGTRFAFLGDGTRIRLTLWEQAGQDAAPASGPAGLHHLAFEVDSVAEVDAVRRRLQEAGARFAYDGVVPHAEGATSGGVFFHDPDGIRLEVYASSGVQGEAPVAGAPTCGFF